MSRLREVLSGHVEQGAVPGAVGLMARGTEVSVAAVGHVDVDGTAPAAPDSIFRIASLTKPITAAAVLILIDDGVLALDAAIDKWLPELASPTVVANPDGPLDDVVPAQRAITVRDLLSSTAGYGFSADFAAPAVQLLFEKLHKHVLDPQLQPPTDTWLAQLADVPMLAQPGERWLYHTCSDLQGILIERATGRGLGEILAERLFDPLGMRDSGFHVPAADLDRLVTRYRHGSDALEMVDAPTGQWSSAPPFDSGAGGLVGTVDDWLRFARMLLSGGEVDGRRVLSADAVRLMTRDSLTAAQRRGSDLFLEGQSWGFGGSVDVAPVHPWQLPGRYGWLGGTGTAAHLIPATDTVTVLFTQVDMAGPNTPPILADFWAAAAD
jgi:CubicO group peptidase (beta-lactamase class C family)